MMSQILPDVTKDETPDSANIINGWHAAYIKLPSHTTVPFILLTLPAIILTLITCIIWINEGFAGASLVILLALLFSVIFCIFKYRSYRKRLLKKNKETDSTIPATILECIRNFSPHAKIIISDNEDCAYITDLQPIIIIPRRLARSLDNESRKMVIAEILHEIGHVIAKDHIYLTITSLLHKIFRTGLLVASILLFVLGITWSLFNLLNSKSSMLVRDVFEDCAFVSVFMLIPLAYFILTGMTTNLIRHACEFRADAFAAAVQRTPEHIVDALAAYAIKYLGPTISTSRKEYSWFIAHILPAKTVLNLLTRLRQKMPKPHPNLKNRINALTGNLWLSLDLSRNCGTTGILLGASISMIAALNMEKYIGFYVFIWCYTSFASYSPAIVLLSHGEMRTLMVQVIRILMITFLGMIIGFILMYGIFFISEIMDQGSISSAARSFQLSYIIPQIATVVIYANIVLYIAFVACVMLVRESLTWYSIWKIENKPRRLLSLFLCIPGILGSFFFLTLHQILTMGIVCVCIILMLLKVSKMCRYIFPKLVHLISKLYKQVGESIRCCPVCNTRLPGCYHLGRVCPSCKTQLHGWLFDISDIK